MVNRWVILNENDEIVNVIIWDGKTEYNPGEGFRLVPESQQEEH